MVTKQNEITVYSIDNCKYCEKVKAMLDCLRLEYTVIEIANDEKSEFLDRIGMSGSDRTFPRVYKEGELIGGFNEVKRMILLGEL